MRVDDAGPVVRLPRPYVRVGSPAVCCQTAGPRSVHSPTFIHSAAALATLVDHLIQRSYYHGTTPWSTFTIQLDVFIVTSLAPGFLAHPGAGSSHSQNSGMSLSYMCTYVLLHLPDLSFSQEFQIPASAAELSGKIDLPLSAT